MLKHSVNGFHWKIDGRKITHWAAVISDACNPKALTCIVHVAVNMEHLDSFIAAAFIHQRERERKGAS